MSKEPQKEEKPESPGANLAPDTHAHVEIQALRKVIHDLNGELFLIRGYADMAMQHVADQEPARRNLQKMIDRSDHVEALLRELRAMVPR